MAKTLRVRTRAGWVTKPAPDVPENRLSAEEVDDNFLEMEDGFEAAATAAGTSFDNTASGLTATDVQAAIDEVDAATYTQTEVDGLLNGLGLTGQVSFFAMNTAPAGWLKANGAAVSRTTYAALFSAIGTTFGAGNGSTTFNLPDMRGEFIRGVDDGRGVDSGRSFGSAQGQDWKGFSQTNTGQNTFNYSHGPVDMGKSTSSFVGNLFIGAWIAPAAAMGTKWNADDEIRPRNVALLACIKY